jgi:hypothetical protein
MSITINLAPETERKLREKAAQRGQTIEEYLSRLADESAASAPVAPSPSPRPDRTPEAPIPPEILEWARQQVSEEQILADLREINETGGLELKDFIRELEQAAGPDE